MKATKFIILFLLLLNFGIGFSQTKEDIEKAQRIQDSMMNSPHMKAIMKQLQQQKSVQEKQETKPNIKVAQTKSGSDKWYWKNTLVSENNTFSNWKNGTVDIALAYRIDGKKPQYLKVGNIQADGRIVLKFPKDVTTRGSLKKTPAYYNPFFDIQKMESLQFTNGETGFISNTNLKILKNDKKIGTLAIGNSVRVTLNLVNQSNLQSGDEGYLLYWAFAQNDCALQVNEDWQGNVYRDGTNTIEVKTNVNYNLNFKIGWNLVKVEVIGKYNLEHERGLDVSWYKNHKHTIIASMPNEAKYYYRAYSQ